MSKNILSAVSAFIVSDNGSVNWDTTLSNIRSVIEMELEEKRETDGRIEVSVDSIFDQVPAGTGIPTPMVVQTVSAILANGNIQAQIEWTAKVEDFLNRTNRFVSKRGRSGGLFRVG